jgi:hypothetical protein
MKKRRVTTPWGLGELPLTPVENKSGWETRKEFYARLEREEREKKEAEKRKAEAPLLAVQTKISRNLLKLRKAQAENLFIVPSEELGAMCTHVPENVPGTVDEIREQIKSAITTGLAGIPIHESGVAKIRKVAAKNLTIDIRQPENIRKIYDYMNDLGVFTSEDVTVPRPVAPVVQPGPERAPDLSELETLNLSSREGAARGRELANAHYYSVEAAAVYQRWTSFLYDTFKYVLTAEAKKAAIQFFIDTNSSYLDPKAWEKARRSLVRRGLMPRTCLTPEEVVAEQWEQRSDRSDTFAARKELATQLKAFGTKVLG